MNNTKKTSILNATIELANEIRLALYEEKEQLSSLYNDILSGVKGEDFLQLSRCQLKFHKKQRELDHAIELVTALEETLYSYYHKDEYDTFYNRALQNMHSMEGVYLAQTGTSFS